MNRPHSAPRAPEPAAPPALRRRWLLPAAVALGAWLAVLATLDTAGVLPTLPGPGLTADEPLYVAAGKFQVAQMRGMGLRSLRPDGIREIFGEHPDHPPLGRWVLGWTGWLTDPHFDDPQRYLVAPYRVAPATAFALLVFLVGWAAGRWYGAAAGAVASISLAVMPRVFAHAHIAALDTFVALFYTVAVFSIWWGFRPRELGATTAPEPLNRQMMRVALAGIVWGLLLLTKVQGLLLIVPTIVWAIVYCRRRAAVLVAVWFIAGFVVFYAGWPWLWLAPLDHLADFLRRTSDRAAIRVLYFGRIYDDKLLPWHYSWVMFFTTVPVGLLALGAAGVASWKSRLYRHPRAALLALNWLFPLVVFSVPGVPVYDGERLFLMVYPLWALAVGRGAQATYDWLVSRWSRQVAAGAISCLLACQAVGLVWMHPFQLSYYNLLAGGLSGADRLGLEATYWGDAVDRRLLGHLAEQAPDGSAALFAPQLYPFHAVAVEVEAYAVLGERVRLAGEPNNARYLVVYNRRAYLEPPHVEKQVLDAMRPENLLFENRRQGVWLARLYRLD